jgi:hypothetical protein
MEKIIKAALTVKYPTASIDALLEVVMATPNPQIATEILLDVYNYPIVTIEAHQKCRPDEANKIFISYDKWTDNVHYSYNPRRTKYGWYLKSLPEDKRYENCLDPYASSRAEYAAQLLITEEEFEKQYSKGHCSGPIDTISIRTSYCDCNHWNSGK